MNECKPLVNGCPYSFYLPDRAELYMSLKRPSATHSLSMEYAFKGKAVQVDSIKPTLKAPGIKLLQHKYDKPLSNFALKFNLRRYTKGSTSHPPPSSAGTASAAGQGPVPPHARTHFAFSPATISRHRSRIYQISPQHSSTSDARCYQI